MRIFDRPNRTAPSILFIGHGESSHARNWVDLFRDSPFDIHFFSMPTGSPPGDWPVPTYISQCPPPRLTGPASRRALYPAHPAGQVIRRYLGRFGRLGRDNMVGRWLAGIIRRTKPDIIQTIGIRYASYFLLNAREHFGVGDIGLWVAQDWGPDLTMDRRLDAHAPRIKAILADCDGYLTDNDYNYAAAQSLGLSETKVAPVGPVLACGGLDMTSLPAAAATPPSQRERIILWPKAYNCAQTTAYPVLEALRLAWDRIGPFRLVVTAVCQEEVRLWIAALPEAIQSHCSVHGRIDRTAFLDLLASARVMLAPTLSDGMPNALAEAMALGAVPVVSPLPSITAHIGEKNALFARNLYPHEIADALAWAMTDDARADAMAQANLALAARLFDRPATREKMLAYYADLLEARPPRRSA